MLPVRSIMEGVTASAEDWPRTCCTQMSAEAEAVDIFYAPLSWDALAIDEAVMLLPNFFFEMLCLLAVPKALPWQEHSCRSSSETTKTVTPLGFRSMPRPPEMLQTMPRPCRFRGRRLRLPATAFCTASALSPAHSLDSPRVVRLKLLQALPGAFDG